MNYGSWGLLKSSKNNYGKISTMNFSPNGERMIVGYDSGTLICWDLVKEK
jgi:WD40 repeat protein